MPPTSNEHEPMLIWVRMFDGRLWHILGQHPRTVCGWVAVDPNPDRAPEYLEDEVPGNAWICTRCVERIHEMAAGARQAWLADPRRPRRGQLPAPDHDGPPEGEFRANNIQADVTPTRYASEDEQEA